jgi:glucan phosphoethanolaminetransferase (alkaline phosphatase superfamily)
MPRDRSSALAEFRRMIAWIAAIGVLMVIGALWYISLYEPLRLHMVIATVAGVFFSILLGSGLFAAAFYSDKSGHDQQVDDATRSERESG